MKKTKDKLEKFINDLDKSSLDHTDSFKIEDELQKIRDELQKENQTERANTAQLEMELFAFTKNVKNLKSEQSDDKKTSRKNKGYQLELSYRWAGETKNEKGENEPFEWPDSKHYGEKEFNYIYERFRVTKNNFAKTEYGFLLLLATKSKFKKDEVAQDILDSLFKLNKKYIKNIKADKSDPKHYSVYLINILEQAFILALSRNSNQKIAIFFKKLKTHIFSIVINWDLDLNTTFRFIADMARLIINHKKEFGEFNLDKVLDKLWEVSHESEKTYLHGAIDLAKLGINFAEKINNQKYDWNRFIGSCYEKLASEAKINNINVYSSFIEDALTWYKKAKDENKIKELETEFFDSKNKIGFATIKTPMPTESIQDFKTKFDNYIRDSSRRKILDILIKTPMIAKLSVVKKQTDEFYKIAPLSALMTKTIADKLGNTVAIYYHDKKEELYEFNFLSTYGLDLQFAMKEIEYFFLESIKNKKLSHINVLSFMEKSWLGQEFDRFYNGKPHTIKLSSVLIESITKIFKEIKKNIKNQNYEMQLMSSIDSLTIKFEYIFRFICERLNIPTYFSLPGTDNIKQEKSLNTLFEIDALQENFKKGGLEDDLYLFRYVFTEKGGINLRNKVAHGLMDIDEYSDRIAIILVILFLKLSSYQFKTTDTNV